MKLDIDLDKDFETTLEALVNNNDKSFMKITGVEPQQLSFINYIKTFVNAQNVSDNSIDGTSNSDKKDVVALLSDIDKPLLKLIALNKIFSKIKNKYGLDSAKAFLTSEYIGKSYLHDAHMASLIPYCYAYDLTKLANEGLFFISNSSSAEPYNAEPPQHLDTFINILKEFVSWTCNRQSGAVGLPNVLLYAYYFWLKDIKSEYNGCRPDKDKDGNLVTGIEDYPNINLKNPNIKYLRQQIQSMIYALNQPFLRSGLQSAFTNVSIFDHEYAHALFDGVVFPDGTLAYDHIDNIIKVQQLYMDVTSEIRNKNMFTFPVLSYSLLLEAIDVDENLEDKFTNKEYAKLARQYCNTNPDKKVFYKFKNEDFARWASDHNCEWMDSNFFMDTSVTSLSNCCRLKSNIKDIGYFNSIGGTALSVGSVKVNTVNLARIAYETISMTQPFYDVMDTVNEVFARLKHTYLEKLKNQVWVNLECLDVIRDIITKNSKERGLLPNIADGLIDMKHMYNTVGFIGIYETLKAFQNELDKLQPVYDGVLQQIQLIRVDEFGNTYYTKYAEDFVHDIFKCMQSTFDEFKDVNDIDYAINCEQIPGESAANKLKDKDSVYYPKLVVDDLPVYGNQFIPLGIKTTIDERVRIAALFDSYCNGGSIAHLNYESNFSNKDTAWEKLIWLAQQRLTYSAFTTKINACKHNHAFFGDVCPVCGGGVYTTYARIVGFYVPVCTWGEKRTEEFSLREWEG